MQTLAPDSFCPLTDPQPYQREQAQPPLAGASFAAEFSFEVIKKLLIGTASGWLERLVRPFGMLGDRLIRHQQLETLRHVRDRRRLQLTVARQQR